MKASLTRKALGRLLHDWMLIRMVPDAIAPPHCAVATVVELGTGGSKPFKHDHQVLVALGDDAGFMLAEKADSRDPIKDGEGEKATPATFFLVRENQIVSRL